MRCKGCKDTEDARIRKTILGDIYSKAKKERIHVRNEDPEQRCTERLNKLDATCKVIRPLYVSALKDYQKLIGDKSIHTHPEMHEGTLLRQEPEKTVTADNTKDALYGIQRGSCNMCKQHFEYRQMHVDHIMPEAKGGVDDDTNLQLLCGSCNTIKGTKTMAEAMRILKEKGIIQ